MQNGKPEFDELFEQVIQFPDPDMRKRLNQLVGLDSHKQTLTKVLSLLVNSSGISNWIKKHHPSANSLVDIVLRRPPLIVLAGDVGSGKTELALTIGDAIARQDNISISLFPLSLSTRGQGRVGQMTQLISAAFAYTVEKAKKLKDASDASTGAVILFVDEADALAQSRENNQMHHEDKAGVNAFIRGVDNLASKKLPAAVIMSTNRPASLDPAIRRRAAEILNFTRPDSSERYSALQSPLTELGLDEKDIKLVVNLTGPLNGRAYGCTYSDLMQRLIPSIVLDAYPDKAVHSKRVIEIARTFVPTTPFKEN